MFCPGCGNQIDESAKFCTSCGMALTEENTIVLQNSPKKAKGLKKGLIAGAGLLVVVLLAALVFVSGSLFSGSGDAVAYIRNDKLYYKENANSKKEAYEIARLHSDAEYAPIEFSEDGKYLYFFSDFEDYTYGTLNQIEVKKIKADSDKNKKNVIEIASDVEIYNYQIIDGNSVIYRCQNGKIEYFDGKEEHTIAKNVSNFHYNKENNTLIYSVLTDESAYTYSIYAGKFSTDMDAEKIDVDVASIISMENSEFIVYSKMNDDNYELYVAGIGQEPEKISKNYYGISTMDAEQKKMIFLERQEVSYSLYEYVEDDCKAEDEGVAAPDAKKYMSEVSLSDVLEEADYEYYKEYPEELTYFYEYRNEDYDIGMKYYYNWEDEITYYYDGIKWYSLDNELYERAWEEYSTHSDRINLRNNLMEEQCTQYEQSAYYYEAGKEVEQLLEGVSSITAVDADKKILYYTEVSYAKKKLSELESVWELEEDMEANKTRKLYIGVAGGNFAELGDKSMYATELSEDKSKCAILAYNGEKYELLMCNIKGKEVSMEETIAKNKTEVFGKWLKNQFYYLTDADDSYGTLCCYENGKSREMTEDASLDDIRVFENETYMISEYASDGSCDILFYDANDKKLEKFSDVEGTPIYISDECIFMIRRDDLYFYNGSEDLKKIDDNVTVYKVNTKQLGSTYVR